MPPRRHCALLLLLALGATALPPAAFGQPAPTPSPGAPAAPSNAPFGARWMSRIEATKVSRALGFHAGRVASLDHYAAKFPALKADADAARAAWTAHFGPAADAMMAELARRDPGFEASWKAMIDSSLKKQIEAATITEAEVKAAIERGTFRPVAQPINYLAPLNTFHPKYAAAPHLEIDDGFMRRLPVPLPHDEKRALLIPTPASWGTITPKDAAANLAMIASNLGYGPAVVRFEAHKYDGAANPGPAELTTLLESLTSTGDGERELNKSTVRIGDDLTAFRTLVAVKPLRDGPGRAASRGTTSVFVRGDTAVLVHVSVFDICGPDEPEPTPADYQRVEDIHRELFSRFHTQLKIGPKPAPPPAAPPPSQKSK